MKWFEAQSKTVKIILLLVPFINWIVELFIRITDLIEDQKTEHILAVVLAILPCFFAWIDLVYYLIKGKLLLK